MDDSCEETQVELKALREEYKKLKDKADQLATQIEGLILCLEKHGTNLNIPFLIDHYSTVLKKYRSEK